MRTTLIRLAIITALAAALALSLWTSARLARQNRELKDRHERNIAALTSDIVTWRLKDSTTAARCDALELKAREAERLCSDLRNQTRRLGLRLKDVNTYAKSGVQYADTVRISAKTGVEARATATTDTCLRHTDRWCDISVCLQKDGAAVTYAIRDTVKSVVHVSYRKKFLWFRWKPEYKATSTASNPHAIITDAAAVVISD